MAYVANDQEDDEQTNNQVSPSGGGSGVHLAPSAGVGSVGSGAGTSNGNSGPGGGSFATINQYLGANQGQAQPLANQITSGINQQYNTLNQQDQGVTSGIQGQVNSGFTAQNNDLLAQEAANPTSFAGNAANVSGFQGQLNDQYTGPQSAESTSAFQNQQSNLNNAIATGQAQTQTEAGREGLLNGIEKTPTAGVTALNSAILSQDPNAQSSIENAYQPFQGLVSGLNQSGQDIDKSITGAQNQAQTASQTAQNQLQGQVAGLNNTVGGETTALQNQFNGYNTQVGQVGQQAQTANQDIQGYLSNTPQVTADTSALNPYLNLQTLTGPAPTNATSATAQDYVLQNALQTLNGATPLQTDINQSTASQAGTALPANFAQLQAQLAGLPAAENTALGNVNTGLGNSSAPALQSAQQIQQFKDLENGEKTLNTQIAADQKALAAAPTNAYLTGNRNAPGQSKQQIAAQKKLSDDQAALQKLTTSATAKADTTAGKVQDANTIGGGQWINGADTGFNSLLSTLGSSMAPVAVNTLPTEAEVMPNTSSGGWFGSGIGNILGAIAAPVTLGATLGATQAAQKAKGLI